MFLMNESTNAAAVKKARLLASTVRDKYTYGKGASSSVFFINKSNTILKVYFVSSSPHSGTTINSCILTSIFFLTNVFCIYPLLLLAMLLLLLLLMLLLLLLLLLDLF